jgi:hypothetical protein
MLGAVILDLGDRNAAPGEKQVLVTTRQAREGIKQAE